ncbi:acyl-CoA dehydrogenase family protein [Nocardia caishijiensis]|uniref:Alkylation response protein AidB-like acyl-CoA dehydrogenase n=1 Tax=Nocardia caishijiensis TaxID=184756 RepID=A0ABQ6YQ26_9NOCA|nr:acyl-CoA dehydrogenase family protein [Nocardia caishijiensis]KAF0847897.1 alkylation response protein AidB-like acyl-CoA dehydrogenase [Nocardia caishijiensis]
MSSNELLEFRSSVRALLTKHATPEALRAAMQTDLGYDEKLWRMLCDQVGVAALAVPEEWGGVGATLVESLMVVGELGRVLSGVPMLGSAVLGVQAILLAGNEEACARLLPDLADGSRTAALCWADADGWESFGVRSDGETLTGTAQYVLNGAQADVLLVLTERGLFETSSTAPGVTVTPTPGLDPTRSLASITFAETPATRIGDPGARLRDVAWAALAAEQVGAARRCLEMTVEYTGARVQFGRPIGSFQALKHRMADMYVLVESAESAALLAAHSLAAGSDSAAEDVWVARAYCTEAFNAVAAETIQLHGGIAITWEHDAHLYFKRAHATAQLFGTARRPIAA